MRQLVAQKDSKLFEFDFFSYLIWNKKQIMKIEISYYQQKKTTTTAKPEEIEAEENNRYFLHSNYLF